LWSPRNRSYRLLTSLTSGRRCSHQCNSIEAGMGDLDLYDKVRGAPSKTVRAALEYYFKDDDSDEPNEESEPKREHKEEHAKARALPARH